MQKLSNKMKNNQITPAVESVVDRQIGRPDVTVYDIAF